MLERLKRRLSTKIYALEKCNVDKIDAVYELMNSVATGSYAQHLRIHQNQLIERSGTKRGQTEDDEDMEEEDLDMLESIRQQVTEEEEKERRMKETIWNYFEAEDETEDMDEKGVPTAMTTPFRDQLLIENMEKLKPTVEVDLKNFVHHNAAMVTSARAVARIFHGIGSPRYPSLEWCRNPYWNKHGSYEFNELVALAGSVIRSYRLASTSTSTNTTTNDDAMME